MADSSRLDELERKFAENPRRYFAPLANEYRKSGDLGTAIAICREQLAHYPGHMSGHVVLGQALYESRQPQDAQRAFERALELDPENLIALRHLGDIARDRGEGTAARAWYQRVLEADPRNDDIAAQLQQLTPMAQRASVAAPEPAAPAYVAPPPPPAPTLEPLEWSALDLDLPGASEPAQSEASGAETAEHPIVPAAPASDEADADAEHVADSDTVAPAAPGDGLLDFDAEFLALPGTEVREVPAGETEPAAAEEGPSIEAPGEEPVAEPAAEAAAVVEVEPAPEPALERELEPTPDPVDWAALLPDELEAEVAPAAANEKEAPQAGDESAAPIAEESAVVEASVIDEAIVAEPMVGVEADDEAAVLTVEEVWLPAAHVPVPEPFPAEPVAEGGDDATQPAAVIADAAEPDSDPEWWEELPVADTDAAVEPVVEDAEAEAFLTSTQLPDEPVAEPEVAEVHAGVIDVSEPETEPETEGVAIEAFVPEPFPSGDVTVDAVEEQPGESVQAEAGWLDAAPPDLAPDVLDAVGAFDVAEDADAPAPAYDPVVGLDLPPVATDEPEPYPAASESQAAAPTGGVPSPAFVTETMAGLLLRQGHLDQALEVYEQLAAQRPDDEALVARAAEVRARIAAPVVDEASEPAAQGGATAGAFFAALAATPAPPALPEPPTTEAAPSAALAQPAVAEAPSGMFGEAPSDADDERAARRLAAGFSMSGTPMTSLADALLVAPPSLPPAATPPAPPSVPVPAEDVPYGLAEFSFERFFEGLEEGAPPEPTTAEPAAAASADSWTPAADVRPEPSRVPTPAAPVRTVEEAPAPASADEDLAQFHAWLKGLMEP